MGLLLYFFILVTSKEIFSAPLNEHSYYVALKTSCTNLKNDILNECSNATMVKVNNVTDGNKHDVLCTVYLYSLLAFTNKLNPSYRCNESLLFPDQKADNSNEFCGNSDFLYLNETKTEKNELFSKNICYQLCLNIMMEVDTKCKLANYYTNYSLNNNLNENISAQKLNEKVPNKTVEVISSSVNATFKEEEKHNVKGIVPNVEANSSVILKKVEEEQQTSTGTTEKIELDNNNEIGDFKPLDEDEDNNCKLLSS